MYSIYKHADTNDMSISEGRVEGRGTRVEERSPRAVSYC